MRRKWRENPATNAAGQAMKQIAFASCEGREVRADILVQIADLAGIAHAFEVRVASLSMVRRDKSCPAQKTRHLPGRAGR